MQLKKLIYEHIKKQSAAADKDPEWQELFDGMSTGTARIVIDREAGDHLPADYAVDLQNKGRYYVAKVVGQNGSVLKRMLVDKQTGDVRLF
ncbi:MAG: hypothetical protein C4519_11480 [Desulfobacteraceae bacterium]|nr:MAG: hypothetical protein C4519_11480 [Desulfobacteraceae bacterium]